MDIYFILNHNHIMTVFLIKEMQLFCEQMGLLSKTYQPQTAVNMSHKIQINDKSVTFQRIELKFCSCEHDTIAQVQLFLKALYVLRLMHTDQKSFGLIFLKSLMICFRWSQKIHPSGREEQCISTESWRGLDYFTFVLQRRVWLINNSDGSIPGLIPQ